MTFKDLKAGDTVYLYSEMLDIVKVRKVRSVVDEQTPWGDMRVYVDGVPDAIRVDKKMDMAKVGEYLLIIDMDTLDYKVYSKRDKLKAIYNEFNKEQNKN